MSRSVENAPFQCLRCGADVQPSTDGSFRNHCPFCLYSRHVDVRPGDRRSRCGSLMRPVGLRRRGRRPQLVHRCIGCGQVKVNRVVETGRQPDDIDVIVTLPADDGPSRADAGVGRRRRSATSGHGSDHERI